MTYPDWICDPCGRKFGQFYINGRYVGPPMRCSTMHMGTCEVCGKQGPVTEPRDYGHLISTWNQ